MTSMTGLVLAGGASRRMGQDKSMLLVDGVRLVDRVVTVLAGVCEEVLVASGDGHRLPVAGTRQVADITPTSGPLAGIIAGLEAAAHPLVAVVAVDLPNASGAVLVRLAQCWEGEVAVIPQVGERLQPLHAVWATAAAPGLRRRLADGRRGVVAAATTLGARVAGPEVWADLDPRGAFAHNLNRPADLG